MPSCSDESDLNFLFFSFVCSVKSRYPPCPILYDDDIGGADDAIAYRMRGFVGKARLAHGLCGVF